MTLVEMKVCPKCGYTRNAMERVPAYECPQCGIIYGKYRPPAAAPPARGKPSSAAKANGTSHPEMAPEAERVSSDTTLDATLLSVAWGVLLEPVFRMTNHIENLGFPGDGWLSEVFGGRLAASFFLVDVGVVGTLLSIGLMAMILFATGAQRSVPISTGRKVIMTLLALNYFVAMSPLEHPVANLVFYLFDRSIWTEVQDASLTLTMAAFAVMVSQHLIRWSRFLQTNDASEGAA